MAIRGSKTCQASGGANIGANGAIDYYYEELLKNDYPFADIPPVYLEPGTPIVLVKLGLQESPILWTMGLAYDDAISPALFDVQSGTVTPL